MIKIDRTTALCPEALRTKGKEDLMRLREIDPATLRTKDFKRTIYGSPRVKTILREMQHGKCCFCEQELEGIQSDVEHFRPKAKASRGDGTVEPGYWWLAYQFDNLYFSCRPCNIKKSTNFPLRPGAPALPPETDPRAVVEECLLIDPGFEDPEQHLTFVWTTRGCEIAPRDQSERGRVTKEILFLDRDDLSDLRKRYYEKVLGPLLNGYARALRRGDEEAKAEIRRQAAALAAADGRFALLARVALRPILESS